MPQPESILTLQRYQHQVETWIQQHGGYFSPLSQLAQLTEELGEVARVINRNYGDQKPKDGEAQKNLADELAGMLFAIACLANSSGIDLATAIETHLTKITKRDATRFT